MDKVKYHKDLAGVSGLNQEERLRLAKVAERFRFRANSYYLNLIDWTDPDDPIRKIVIPSLGELDEFGELDASKEEANYVVEGCQHKYPHTALLLVTEMCGGFCRFCFRKRLFMEDNVEATANVGAGIDYISRTPSISNVLVSGGDPLTMSTRRLTAIIDALMAIPHIRIVRIGTKMPAFDPYRIIDDQRLLESFARYSRWGKRLYIMTHFNVPNELTAPARQAVELLHRCGAVLANQSPILRGINDNPEVLAELMRQLASVGAPAYYFFQCRPTVGNRPFNTSIVHAYRALERAKKKVSGLEKRARMVMSHASGKVAIVGLNRHHIYMRYHRAKQTEDEGRFMAFYRDDHASWLDDLRPVDFNDRDGGYDHSVENYGPN